MLRHALAVGVLCLDTTQTEPITKIVDTVQNLLQSCGEEGQLDQENYKEYYSWCQQTFEVRKQAQNSYNSIAQELQAKLAVQQAVNKQLRDEAMQLQQEGADAKQATQQAAQLRQSEHDDYVREQKNLAGMLQMLNRAVDVLTTSASRQTLLSVAQSVQQLAAKTNLVSDSQRDQLTLFVQETQNGRDGDEDRITETASVNQVLRELISQFQSTMSNASLEEKKADEQFSLLIGLKKESFMEYVTSKDAKDAILAESVERTAQNERALQDAQVVVKSGENYLKAIQSLCTHKSNQWASRSQIRQDIMASMQSVISQMGTQHQPVTALETEQQLPSMSFSFVGQTDSQIAPTRAPSFLQIPPGLDMQVPPSIAPQSSMFKVPPPNDHMAKEQKSALVQKLPTLMDVQENFNTPQTKESTYSAVRKMVDDMSTQLQAENDDERRHKSWCSTELAKNTAMEKNKASKVQRLSTKIANERHMTLDLDHDLELLSKAGAEVSKDVDSLHHLKMAERVNYNKFAQNHKVATQILRQAVGILQRFKSLAETRGQATGSTNVFMAPEINAVSLAIMDSLSQLLTRYEELRIASDKSENQSVIDYEQCVKINKNVAAVLTQTKTYKQSVRLQAMTDLENDSEDNNALKAQEQSVHAYVTRLRQACADVLQHYDERRRRRNQNLQALSQAGQVINLENADALHTTLSTLAQKTDNDAAQLLKTSQSTVIDATRTMSTADVAHSPQPAAVAEENVKAKMESTNADILKDLRTLQEMGTHQSDGLNMLPLTGG